MVCSQNINDVWPHLLSIDSLVKSVESWGTSCIAALGAHRNVHEHWGRSYLLASPRCLPSPPLRSRRLSLGPFQSSDDLADGHAVQSQAIPDFFLSMTPLGIGVIDSTVPGGIGCLPVPSRVTDAGALRRTAGGKACFSGRRPAQMRRGPKARGERATAEKSTMAQPSFFAFLAIFARVSSFSFRLLERKDCFADALRQRPRNDSNVS
jgi:hypothetical protein